MSRIYKYDLEITEVQEIELPRNAKIISVQVQYENSISLWTVESSSLNVIEKRKIIMIGTGQEVKYDLLHRGTYLGTVQLYNGNTVYHVFDYFTGMMGM